MAPQVAIAPPDTEVMLTNTVLFTCVGYGYPLPAISWSFQGNEITNNSRVLLFTDVLSLNGSVFIQSVLQLCGVESSDEGDYTCVLSNIAGYDQSNFFVDVLGELFVVWVVSSSSSLSLRDWVGQWPPLPPMPFPTAFLSRSITDVYVYSVH